MKIYINDKPTEITEGCTLAQALREQSLPETGIATALNGNVVARDARETTVLAADDKILIIKAFYGG